MLTLEALFTALLAWRLYGETVDQRVVLAMGALLGGGVVLALEQGLKGGVQLMGLLAVMAATVAWGIDNTLSRGVADRDPGQVVLVKSALGCLATGTVAWLNAEPMPPWGPCAMLVAIGGSGYGLSLRFYLLAQRTFGAARTGSVFAFAPFIGAAAAFALGERGVSPFLVGGGVLMLAGVLLHLTESHNHEHPHSEQDHEHAHRHDDGHHDHRHDPMPEGSHSHWHRHAPVTHGHAHVPDLHHTHTH
jgi:drug/metabolite transporter (DMT)-like permease